MTTTHNVAATTAGSHPLKTSIPLMLRTVPRATLAALLSLLITVGGGCGSSESSSASQLSVEDFRYVRLSNGERQVMGTLRNAGASPVRAAQVEVSLFDADNVRIGSMDVTVQDIPANGTKQFEQPIDSDKPIDGARVRSVLVMR